MKFFSVQIYDINCEILSSEYLYFVNKMFMYRLLHVRHGLQIFITVFFMKFVISIRRLELELMEVFRHDN